MQMGVRMYSARIGRFLSVDPLHEIMPSHNPYHYAFNSPLVWKDPSGLAPEKDKNIHSEKLQGQLICIRGLSTDTQPGGEFWVYEKDGRDRFIDFYFSAEYDAGFYQAALWQTNLSMFAMLGMGGSSSSGGGDEGGGPRTYDPYHIYESFIGGARKSLRGVQANGKVAQDAVKRSVEDSYEKYIGFDEDGFVQFSKGYVEAAKKAGSASNISKLIDLAQNFYLTISMVKGNTKFDIIGFSFTTPPPELGKPYPFSLDDFESSFYGMSNLWPINGIFLASKLSFQKAVDLTNDNTDVRTGLFFSEMNQLGGTIYLESGLKNIHKIAAEELYLHAYLNYKNTKWWHSGIKNNDNLLKSIFDKAGR